MKKILAFLVLGLALVIGERLNANVCTGSELNFKADLIASGSEWNHFWEECVGSGHALLGLRQGTITIMIMFV